MRRNLEILFLEKQNFAIRTRKADNQRTVEVQNHSDRYKKKLEPLKSFIVNQAFHFPPVRGCTRLTTIMISISI
jgi:hypothetical protein